MTRKEVSVLHEDDIARLYDGERTPNSGAGHKRKGDVSVESTRTSFECKATGSPPDRWKHSVLVTQMEKIADEAWTENREPALALRWFDPGSPLANRDGWVDLVVRRATDDAAREVLLNGD